MDITPKSRESEALQVLDDNAPPPAVLARLPSRADVMGQAVAVNAAQWRTLT